MISPNAIRGLRIEKTANLYDADWNALLPRSMSVAKLTCIAVRTMAMQARFIDQFFYLYDKYKWICFGTIRVIKKKYFVPKSYKLN